MKQRANTLREMQRNRSNVSLLVLLFLQVVVLRFDTSSAQQPVYDETFYSTSIEPFYDDSGFEVDEDQVLELTDLKSTTLGFGLGLNYSFTVIPRQPEVPAPLLPQTFSTPSAQVGPGQGGPGQGGPSQKVHGILYSGHQRPGNVQLGSTSSFSSLGSSPVSSSSSYRRRLKRRAGLGSQRIHGFSQLTPTTGANKPRGRFSSGQTSFSFGPSVSKKYSVGGSFTSNPSPSQFGLTKNNFGSGFKHATSVTQVRFVNLGESFSDDHAEVLADDDKQYYQPIYEIRGPFVIQGIQPSQASHKNTNNFAGSLNNNPIPSQLNQFSDTFPSSNLSQRNPNNTLERFVDKHSQINQPSNEIKRQNLQMGPNNGHLNNKNINNFAGTSVDKQSQFNVPNDNFRTPNFNGGFDNDQTDQGSRNSFVTGPSFEEGFNHGPSFSRSFPTGKDLRASGTFGHFPSVGFGEFPGENKMCAPEKPLKCNAGARYRALDGSCNNLARPKWGAINQAMRRLLPAVYFDGYDIPRITSTADPRRLLPSARLVSRNVHEPAAIKGHNLPDLSNLLQVWGQFLDHDITGTPAHKGKEGRDLMCCEGVYLTENQQIHRDVFDGGRCNPIFIPPRDRHFTYSCMNFARSIPTRRRRDCDQNAPKEVREQMNMLTAWIDGSQVYGSTLKKAHQLRVFHKGLLKATRENLLPEDTNSTCVKEEPGDYCFMAGEKRVNEHAGLMALHIVFLRYHNEMALKLASLNPRWTDEKIYQEVRRVIGAIFQHVTYHDWLPTVLGPSIMRQYSLNVLSAAASGPSIWRYHSQLDPTIINAFATAAFRFGHTMIPSFFTMGDVQVRLFTMFNRPKFILQHQGLGKMCAGMLYDPAHHSDRFMSTDLSDRLFEDRNNVSMDLASLNIHRARDHGLPSYNQYRKWCGLPVYHSFEEMLHTEPERAKIFMRVYDDVDDIDLFAGGLSEKPLAESVTGPTFACLLATQFHNLKFADRFWYENPQGPQAFTRGQLLEIRKMTLSRIMCKTTNMHTVTVNPLYQEGVFLPRGVHLPNGAFVTQNRYVPCEDLPEIDFTHWFDPKAQM